LLATPACKELRLEVCMSRSARVLGVSIGICAIAGVTTGCPSTCTCAPPSPSGELSAATVALADAESRKENDRMVPAASVDSLLSVGVMPKPRREISRSPK
jgi:hypothetical protein